MKKQDGLSILITLIAGFMAGMYLYVVGFAGIGANLDTSTIEQYEDFVIQGELYGGCRSRCNSFQVLNDGSYRYLVFPSDSEASSLKQGTLPANLQRELGREVTVPQLVAQSRPDNKEECPSFTDGLDVRYEITFRGTDYTLDSCTTRVEGESDLWQALFGTWEHIRTAGNNDQ